VKIAKTPAWNKKERCIHGKNSDKYFVFRAKNVGGNSVG
jgi:hypothetical protein